MTTTTPKLGLIKPTTTDHWSTADYQANLDKLDAQAGRITCTSTTRPVWGVNQAGMTIYETDRDLEWLWTGSAWRRMGPKGWLAGASRSSSLTVTSTVEITIVQTAVTVPAGGRRINVQTLWQTLYPTISNDGALTLLIYRDSTQLFAWDINVQPVDDGVGGNGGSLVYPDSPAAGSYTYALRMACITNASVDITMQMSSTRTSRIDVFEV